MILALAGAVLVFTTAPVVPSGQVLRRVNPEHVDVNRLAWQMTNLSFLAYPPAWCQAIPALSAEHRSRICLGAASLPRQVRGLATDLSWWQGWTSAVLCMFLVCFYAGRRRLHRDAARHTRLLLWVAAVSLPLGLAGNGLSVYGEFFSARGIALPDTVARWVSDYYIGNIGLALFCLSGLTLLFTHWRRAARALAPLANVGRMGLTNYLMQSVVFSLILGSFGFDVMSHVKEGYSLLAINSFFVVQVLYSSWWFKHFRFGPAEWVWRSLTWWRLQPMRVQARPPSGEAR